MIYIFSATVLAFFIIAFLIPKKRTRQEILVIVLFTLFVSSVSDVYLDLKYEFYWYFKKEVIDWKHNIALIGQSSVMIIIFNYFPMFSSELKKLIYILAMSIGLTLLELYSVYIVKVLHYGSWKIQYSAITYLGALYLLYLLLKFTSEERSKERK